MISLEGKHVTVVGLGTSGAAACRLLLRRGARVVGTDAKREIANPADLDGVRLCLGGHAGLEDAEIVVVSPGVPSFPELEAAEKRGVPIWSEVELAFRCLPRPVPIVAVGGTNGKSTTTSLVGAILERAGLAVFVGGNLGEPLSDHVDEPLDAIVLEVSSFQLERVDAFHPKVALLLNVTPDHLDRYAGLEAYASAKGNAFLLQTKDDVAVVPTNDAVCLAQAKRGGGRVVTFGPNGDVDVQAAAIVDRAGAVSYDRARIFLKGGHNALNVAAAIAAVRAFRLDPHVIAEVLHHFRGLPHRMAFVRKLGGVAYYDDSKGTNVGAAVTAVQGIGEERVVLLAGGRDKGGSYGPLASALREKGRAVVLLGDAAPIIAREIGNAIPVRHVASMDQAVLAAQELARAGDAVLLSPACSSFDMFKDYKERGDAFVRAVLALPGASEA